MSIDCIASGNGQALAAVMLTVKSPTIELNPNASVFESKSPTVASSNVQPDWPEGSQVTKDSSETDTGSVTGHVNSGRHSDVTEGSGEMAQPSPSHALANDDVVSLEGTVPEEQLRMLLRTQLDYYFSRENLAGDMYLISQMDADQYVPIATIANFNQVRKLTRDYQLIVDMLRESPSVQVDAKGEKVRPLIKRSILILREIPDETPIEEVKQLFNSDKCPAYINCEFAHNNSWYVAFETEEDAQRAYQYLREDVRTFHGQPIMARIKAKPLVRSTFPSQAGGIKARPAVQFEDANAADVAYSSQAKFMPQSPPVYAPLAPANVHYVQGVPYFTASPAVPTIWPPTSPPAISYYDPGVAFAANGYTPAYAQVFPQSASRLYPHGGGPGGARGGRGGRGGNKTYGGRDREGAYHDRHQPHPHPHPHTRGDREGVKDTARSSSANGAPTHSSALHNGVSTSHNAPPSSAHSPSDSGRSRPDSAHDAHFRDRDPRERRVNSFRGNGLVRRRREDEVKRFAKDKSSAVPEFELETSSFPPLPGLRENQQATENVVKGQVQGHQEDSSKQQQQQPPVSAPQPLTIKKKAPRDAASKPLTLLTNSSSSSSRGREKEQDENMDPNKPVATAPTPPTMAHVIANGSCAPHHQSAPVVNGDAPVDKVAKVNGDVHVERVKVNGDIHADKVAKVNRDSHVEGIKVNGDVHSDRDTIEDALSSKMSYAKAALIGKAKVPEVTPVKVDDISTVEVGHAPVSPPAAKQVIKSTNGMIASNGRQWKHRHNNDLEAKVSRGHREVIQADDDFYDGYTYD